MLASMPDPAAALAEFVTYVGTHLTGDEKGEAADFLDHLFRALGHAGVQEAGASREVRVAKKGFGSKGKNYIDLLWPERVLMEMKSRGKKLERHYDQIFDYWTHIVPHRPPYVILCNFDEFWIYDFNQQLFDPVDKTALADLPQRATALAFLLPKPGKPLFRNNRVEVTRKAASDLSKLFRALILRGENRNRAQRFILQILVALVSEDMNLLPRQILARLVDECRSGGGNSYDLIGGLFRQMNTYSPARGGRFTDVPYFNGGLFAEIDPIELLPVELDILAEVAERKWDQVKPEIFGTLFQTSMDADERHAYGAHFTSEFDIQKVVGPTIVRPWRARMAEAWESTDRLMEVLAALRAFRVLDPACGSGNFLAVTYREMKRIEQDILNRLREFSRVIRLKGNRAARSVPPEALMNAVSIRQFYGMDVLPFATELAKVTLMVAKEMWIVGNSHIADSESLFARESPLPLDNLDKNILCADALFTDWPKADAIVGNPPYLGSRYIAQEYGYDYSRKLHERFADVPKMADFVTHWFRLANDALPPNGRGGLVARNSVRHNESRQASLDYVVQNGGTITEAVSTQVWSGDASVHVSIVNWVMGTQSGKKLLHTQIGDRTTDPWKIEELDFIPPNLASHTDVSTATILTGNQKPKLCFQGQNPVNVGFMMEPEIALEIHAQHPDHKDVIFPYMTGDDLVGNSSPGRWIVDFAKRDQFEARAYPVAFRHVQEHVMQDVLDRAENEKAATGKDKTRWTRMAERWWQFRDYQPGLMGVLNELPRYIACSRTTRRPIFEFVDTHIHPDTKLAVITLPDDYSFGIISSGTHWDWFLARCSTWKSDFNYTGTTVFDTFPWPQSPTRKQIETVAKEAVALRRLRHVVMAKMNWSLRDLYRTLEEPGSNPLRDAQAKLDTAVRAAYAMPKDADVLAFLLQLNHACAAKEAAGEPITPPGLPLPVEEHPEFVTEDCIKV